MRSRLARLVVVSALSLFVEMLLIRWISTEVRIFAHLKNLGLIACFAGLGIGLGTGRRTVSPQVTFAGMATLSVLALPPSLLGALSLKNLSKYILFTDLYSWTPAESLGVVVAGLLALVAVFTLIVFMFIPLGESLGELFSESRAPLRDYSVNVAASLGGIVAFTALSVAGAAPWVWFVCAFVPMLIMLPRRLDSLAFAVTCIAIMVGAPRCVPESPALQVQQWSPYQKIQVWKVEAHPGDAPRTWQLTGPMGDPAAAVMHMLEVSDTAMMWMLDLSKAEMARHPWLTWPGKIEWYNFPYHVHTAARRVLVIGAGGGNDTAAALRHGAEHVDAVEIDPCIAALGRRFHPEHPYDDPRVTVHITDARRFLAATHETYDLVVFAQLDNTDYNAMSNLSNIRMDSYIYTREAFSQAYGLLAPDGVMVVNFGATEAIGRRTVKALLDATGQLPRSFANLLQLLFPGQQNAYVLDRSGRLDRAAASDPVLSAWVKSREAHWQPDLDAPEVTDDWPFWFLPKRAIPSLQALVMVSILAVSAGLAFLLLPRGRRAVSGRFFFLGAAFMLLEVHSISRVALVLGATWLPNAAVVSAILIMILAANFVVERFKPSPRWVWLGLFCAVALQLLPLHRGFDASNPGSVALLLGLYALPLFFAGLVFARAFATSDAPADALRSNLVGSVFGGVLELLGFVIGMRALVIVVAVLYGLAAASKVDMAGTVKGGQAG